MYRSELEVSFSERIQAVKERFSGDQESSVERFQADVLKHEQHYQSELTALSEKHEGQKLLWEAELDEAKKQRGVMEEAMEKERERRNRERSKDRHERESFHKEELDGLLVQNNWLQNEKERSRQMNDLYTRLQENLETKELLLNHTTEERMEQLSLESKYNDIHVTSEQQRTETIDLLTEQELMESEELKVLLKQAPVDVELDRERQQRHVSVPEETLKDNSWKVKELATKRALLRRQEQEFELHQGLTSVDAVDKQDCINMELNPQQDVNHSSFTFSNSSNLEQRCSLSLVVHRSQVKTPLNASYSVDGGLDHVNMLEKMLKKSPEQDSQMALDENHTKQSQNAIYPNKENQICAAFKTVDLNAHIAWNSQEFGHCQEEDTELHLRAVENNRESCLVDLHYKELYEVIQDKTDDDIITSSRDEDKLSRFHLDFGSSSFEDEPCHDAVVEPSLLEKQGHQHTGHSDFSGPIVEGLNAVGDAGDAENQTRSLFELSSLYRKATEENILLHEKISLLQQKTELLDSLLAHNNEKVKTGHQVLEENYSLKVKMVLLIEHVKELEMKTLKMTDLQIQYEDCMCENTKLKEQNFELEYRVWSLETRMNIFHDEQFSHMDGISKIKDGNAKMLGMIKQMETTSGVLLEHEIDGWFQNTTDEDLLDLTSQMEPLSHPQDCSSQIEKLHYFITELQDKWHRLNEKTQAHR